MRLLLVEDDALLGDGIRQGLRQEGHAVDWIRDGAAAIMALESESFDLVLLDLGLPRLSGLEVLKSVRKRQDILPILIITARDTVEDKILGLDSGADDYLVKPFDLEELAARVRALLRRRSGRAEECIACGPLRLDPAARRVTLNDQPVPLSGREFALLQILLVNAGRVLTRNQLEERLYGWDEEIGSNAVEVHIHNLRKKLGDSLIRNIRGVGYLVEKA